ncbi:MAG: transposase [Paludibacter sp.]|nr:transposase [Paludibacter sp.]
MKTIMKGGLYILYGSSKIWLNDLDDMQILQLHKLVLLSRDLYNLSIKTISDHYLKTEEVLDYQQIKALIYHKPEYQEITGCYYAVILSAISDFKKFSNKTKNNYRPPNLKEDYYPIMISKLTPKDGYIILPSTKQTEEIKLKFPAVYGEKSILKVIIRPLFQFKAWQMIIEYPVMEKPIAGLDKSNAMGIDLGIINFATCATSKGESFIIDGKKLKSIIQGFCKYNAKLVSRSGGKHNTKRLVSLYCKTQNRVNDYVQKSISYIIKYCLRNGIGQIVIGWGDHFINFDIGRNNQLFSYFPFARFKELLFFKCKENGIIFQTVDECFTSQASFLDGDFLPWHITKEKQHFSGKRCYRGLYIAKDGREINADVNGALNILRKGKGNAVINIDLSGRGIATPKRINPLKD